MSDKFFPVPLPNLIKSVLNGIDARQVAGIPASLFFKPMPEDRFCMNRYGKVLTTPFGVAAGPHTQLALNIVAAWLCGARYIELKTIQALDELAVSKPCIDMQDEGYNCEWSQELRIWQSFREYLHAWILIHILHRELGFAGNPGTLFNMSAGYNFEGILNENVQWFFSRMLDCSAELEQSREEIRSVYPAIDEVEIPACISDHITLSTMHGCPPGEIEKIGHYLIREKKLHTAIKLNPTLLGPDELRAILNGTLGFNTEVPDQAFEHDLKYDDALRIIRTLSESAAASAVGFGIKLTNTLESLNNRQVFTANEPMMYMSGRALHPVSILLAQKLQHSFGGELDISFSAGADCFNIAGILACGLKPVTVCSDLLKPGGYGRLWQYVENLRVEMAGKGAGSLDALVTGTCTVKGISMSGAILANLDEYAAKVLKNEAYKKDPFTAPDIRTSRPLGYFDCVHAPCKDSCPTGQDIPGYLYHSSKSDFQSAFDTVFSTNPFPSVTGMICDHLCQLKCTRINIDEALQIREVKRYIASNAGEGREQDWSDLIGKKVAPVAELRAIGPKAAIIGAGPAGLSCAWFLNNAGFDVHIFEQKTATGGMVSAAIPSFRLTDDAIGRDLLRISSSGIHFHYNTKISKENFGDIRKEFPVVFLAAGAQQTVKLNIGGIGSPGVIDPLEFLFNVHSYAGILEGKRILVIGGGNTAMDAARTAFRLAGEKGSVRVVYRRTRKEMPADRGEIRALTEEGIGITEQVNPEQVQTSGGKVSGLLCSRNRLERKEDEKRAVPVKIPGSEFVIPCEIIIPAIGQQLNIDFISSSRLNVEPGSYRTGIHGIYIGGDALRGASTAINAIADGRKAAAEIMQDLGLPPIGPGTRVKKQIRTEELMRRKAIRRYGDHPAVASVDDRRNFNQVSNGFTRKQAIEESSRCLFCDELCNICVTVCPNLANRAYHVDPVIYHLKKAVVDKDGTTLFTEDTDFIVAQAVQVLNIRDLCNECGNCTTFCPSSGRPFADKPGLSLSMESFQAEQEGYFLSRLPGKDILIYKEGEHIRTLTLEKGKYIYETDQVRVTLDPVTLNPEEIKFLTPCVKEFRFGFAAGMSLILKGSLQVAGEFTDILSSDHRPCYTTK